MYAHNIYMICISYTITYVSAPGKENRKQGCTLHTRERIYIKISTHAYTRVYPTYIHIHIYIYTCIYTYIYIYTYHMAVHLAR